jgi:predicted AAA+ superfamily ATPase
MSSPEEFLIKLYKNLQILELREAKYGSLAAPISLITQIEDYHKAIVFTKQAIEQNISVKELEEKFVDLNLEIRDQVHCEPTHKKFTGQNPFRGLEMFTENESGFFFGRMAATNQLISLIKEIIETKTGSSDPVLLAVVGASGSGKSSLVRAGLIPKSAHKCYSKQ